MGLRRARRGAPRVPVWRPAFQAGTPARHVDCVRFNRDAGFRFAGRGPPAGAGGFRPGRGPRGARPGGQPRGPRRGRPGLPDRLGALEGGHPRPRLRGLRPVHVRAAHRDRARPSGGRPVRPLDLRRIAPEGVAPVRPVPAPGPRADPASRPHRAHPPRPPGRPWTSPPSAGARASRTRRVPATAANRRRPAGAPAGSARPRRTAPRRQAGRRGGWPHGESAAPESRPEPSGRIRNAKHRGTKPGPPPVKSRVPRSSGTRRPEPIPVLSLWRHVRCAGDFLPSSLRCSGRR